MNTLFDSMLKQYR